MDIIRDNKWLEDKLYFIWETYFNDVPRKNLVLIKFGRKSKRQLGCIRLATNKSRGLRKLTAKYGKADDNSISVITITKYFQDKSIPEFIVDGTIVHEMCHYTHGFNSPLKKIYLHPHNGGVIRKEMSKRGLGDLYKSSNDWLKHHWQEHTSR